MYREQNAGQYHNVEIGNKSFISVEQCQCLETILTHQNIIHKKSRADLSQVLLTLIWCRVVCLPVGYPKI
jgi:hypothetical protein